MFLFFYLFPFVLLFQLNDDQQALDLVPLTNPLITSEQFDILEIEFHENDDNDAVSGPKKPKNKSNGKKSKKKIDKKEKKKKLKDEKKKLKAIKNNKRNNSDITTSELINNSGNNNTQSSIKEINESKDNEDGLNENKKITEAINQVDGQLDEYDVIKSNEAVNNEDTVDGKNLENNESNYDELTPILINSEPPHINRSPTTSVSPTGFYRSSESIPFIDDSPVKSYDYRNRPAAPDPIETVIEQTNHEQVSSQSPGNTEPAQDVAANLTQFLIESSDHRTHQFEVPINYKEKLCQFCHQPLDLKNTVKCRSCGLIIHGMCALQVSQDNFIII